MIAGPPINFVVLGMKFFTYVFHRTPPTGGVTCRFCVGGHQRDLFPEVSIEFESLGWGKMGCTGLYLHMLLYCMSLCCILFIAFKF
jgi:hypothetical protein